MKRAITIFLTGVGLFFLTGIVSAQDMIIYPAKGQSQEQLDKDKYECYSWAKKQTGFDPMQMPTASTPPPQQEPRRGGLVVAQHGGLRLVLLSALWMARWAKVLPPGQLPGESSEAFGVASR